MILIKKENLINILSQHTSHADKFLAYIRVKPVAQGIVVLRNLIFSLPPGELTLVQLFKLFNLLNNGSKDITVTPLYIAIKKELALDWRYILINSLYIVWRQSPYYTHSHALVATIDELMPSLSSTEKSIAGNVLAITTVMFSLYGIKNQLFILVFSGILSRSLGDALTTPIPSTAFGNILDAKRIVGWAVGLSVQIGLDVVLRAEGAFWISYVGGTSFQAIANYGFTKLTNRFVSLNTQQKYPASISFLKLAIDDIAYLMGTMFVHYSKRALKEKPVLKIEKPLAKASPTHTQHELNNKPTPIVEPLPQLKSNNIANKEINYCSPPEGSYLTTCSIDGNNYLTDDFKLSQVEMCEFDLNCKTLTGGSKRTTFHIQRSMRDCLTFLENCDGQPVVRSQNERMCLTAESAKTYSNDNSIGKGDECLTPQGSFQETCKVIGKRYYSTDKKLTSVLMCEFDINCETLSGTSQKTTLYAQSALRNCLSFFENCDGSLVAQTNNEQLCKIYDVAKEQATKYKFAN